MKEDGLLEDIPATTMMPRIVTTLKTPPPAAMMGLPSPLVPLFTTTADSGFAIIG